MAAPLTRPTDRTRGALAALLLAAGGLTTGCTGGSTVSVNDAVQQLKTRPDIDQAMTRYNALVEQLKTELTNATGIQPWQKIGEPDAGGCTEFGNDGTRLNAQIRDTATWSAPGIPVDRWPQALEAIKKVIEPAGFTTTETMKDQPGDHVLFIHGPDKSVLYIGTAKKTDLYLTSGCHRIPGKPIDPDHPQNS